MAQNVGTLVGAAIRPLTDTMPIASAYATEIKGGLHFATSSTDRDAIIVERRDWGMMCYVIDDHQTYQLQYNLLNPGGTDITDNNNWEVFSGSGGGGLSVKYYIEPSDNILVPLNYQYWIYGDLTIAGNFVNYGQVVIANGGLVMSGGSFSNYGSLAFVSFVAGATTSFNDSDTIGYTVQNTVYGPSVSSFVLPNSLTASVLSSLSGPTAGYLLSVDSNGVFNWVSPINGGGLMSNADKNYIMSYDTTGDGQFAGLTLSNVPINKSYISVYVNGQEFEVGDGSTMSSSCYFSGDSGSTAKDFVGINAVQAGDGLYWNGLVAGIDLYATWRISVHYLV
jgi:hypothetical protein